MLLPIAIISSLLPQRETLPRNWSRSQWQRSDSERHIHPIYEGRPKISRPQIIGRCMDFLEQQAVGTAAVADLATAAGVSERTLRTAFNQYFSMGPIRYLQLRRLKQVRRALLDADADVTTVRRVLIEHGEWEFSRFASRYRQQFGELPSETLHTNKRRSVKTGRT